MCSLQEVDIIGVHRVDVTPLMIAQYERVWGTEGWVRDFEGVCLIEIQCSPFNAKIEWCKFTQKQLDQPKSSWQVPWAERAIDAMTGRWSFFLHNVDFGKPLETPLGPRKLPAPTVTPMYLANCRYELPG
jgi:hypothetical protein